MLFEMENLGKCKMSKIVHPNTYVFNKFHHESVVSQLKPRAEQSVTAEGFFPEVCQ
jgi:hypothetical protein